MQLQPHPAVGEVTAGQLGDPGGRNILFQRAVIWADKRQCPDLLVRPVSQDDRLGEVAVEDLVAPEGLGKPRIIDRNLFEIIRNIAACGERFAGKPFEIVGVNRDPQASLRQLQASGMVDWPNFSDPDGKLTGEYRVGVWPLAYVLDGSRKIHYVGAMGSFVELTAAAVMADKK